MEPSGSAPTPGVAAKRLARQLLTILQNRLELAAVEMQEGREHMLRAILFGLIAGVFAVLAGVGVTAAVVLLFWEWSATGVLLVLAGLYGLSGAASYWMMSRALRGWTAMSSSLDQLGKDRECLEKFLSWTS